MISSYVSPRKRKNGWMEEGKEEGEGKKEGRKRRGRGGKGNEALTVDAGAAEEGVL